MSNEVKKEGIKNRYEFLSLIECINGNPNGDPDAGNSPRIDPEDMHGLISDVAVKRRVRNYVQMKKGNESPYGIFIQQSTNLNKFIAKSHEETGGIVDKPGKEKVKKAKGWLCENFYDIRTFGAVLSTGVNAGQVRGPVQIAFSKSIDSIVPLDISITRMAVTEDKGVEKKTFEGYEEWELKQPENELRTFGRKSIIPYGLYVCKGFISANLADGENGTGFNEDDLELFWEALLNMYEHDHSASKGEMATINPLIIFKHVGTDTDESQKEKQAKLGVAPAHKLFELVEVNRREEIELPRKYADYELKIKVSKLPNGVEMGLAYIGDEGKTCISWFDNNKTIDKDELPEVLSWVTLE